MAKIVTADEAVQQVKSGATLFVNSFSGICYPDDLAAALGKRFTETGEPRDLNFWGTVTGSRGMGIFSERFCFPGLLKRCVISHWGTAPCFSDLAMEEKIEAYNIPMGTFSNLVRAAAGRKPAIITEVGIKTGLDPRFGGGKFNDSAKEDIVELTQIDGKDYLLYKTPKIDICFLRGTTADINHNVTMEKEAAFIDIMTMAQATKANGGIVICQIERLSAQRSHPKEIKLPGLLIDYLVIAENQRINRVEEYNPCYTGDLLLPREQVDKQLKKLLGLSAAIGKQAPRKLEDNIVARRAASELYPGAVVNLGVGIPDMIGGIANRENVMDDFLLTVEAGIVGGIPAPAGGFGSGINPQIIYEQVAQFDLYNGRGLDLAFVGTAEVDSAGNVNVSRIGKNLIGVGGFVDITQRAKKVVYCSTFVGGKMQVEFVEGKLNIVQDGSHIKFKNKVQDISFSGEFANEIDQEVLYITERCVFKLTKEGLMMTEIAPGVDIEKDILNKMEFRPLISDNLKVMEEIYFTDKPLGLKEKLHKQC